jgi:hypothetical protein
MKIKSVIAAVLLFFISHAAVAFEGHITAEITGGAAVSGLLYTVGTNYLRIEQINTDRPRARNIVNLQTGEWTLLFPQNSTFVRLKSGVVTPSSPNAASAFPPPGMRMPAMPLPPTEKIELTATGETTNLLGVACARYEIKRRGQTMEVWATDQLFGFQPYRENQLHRFGPRLIDEQWGELLKAKNLFPLLAVLRIDGGAERLRFEVKSITPENVAGESEELFQPPHGYIEIQPLPF